MYDVVIIGAGPAGLSASIYAKRAGLSAVTVEQSAMSGGQVLTTYEVDNYPGFPGINGFDLGMRFREHADGLSCEFQEAEVLRVEESGDGYLVTTSGGELKTKTIVAAMGAEHAKLNIPGEEELAGMGVSYCATCDGAFFKNRTVAVVGGGDVAVEDAIFLARNCAQKRRASCCEVLTGGITGTSQCGNPVGYGSNGNQRRRSGGGACVKKCENGRNTGASGGRRIYCRRHCAGEPVTAGNGCLR